MSSFELASSGLVQGIFWDHAIFATDRWGEVMSAVRIALPLALALLLVVAARLANVGRPVPERWQKRVAIGFAVVAFASYFGAFNPNGRYRDFYHRHALYHDYLSAKYSDEIGYRRLYECAAVAATELGHGSVVRDAPIRDWRDQRVKPFSKTPALVHAEVCKTHFSAERWEAWKRDVAWFYDASAGDYWKNMQQDHGFHFSPVWTMTAKLFTGPPAGARWFAMLSSLDVLLDAGMFLLLGWAFGWRAMTVAAVFWASNAASGFYWNGGAFLRDDWLFLLVASVCLARKRHFALAGAALTWSALSHVLPAVLFVGPAIVVLFTAFRLIRRRLAAGPTRSRRAHAYRSALPRPRSRTTPPELLSPSLRRAIAGAVIATAIVVPASLVSVGPAAYDGFVTQATSRDGTPFTNDIGLSALIAHDWSGRMSVTRDQYPDDDFEHWRQGQLDRVEQRSWLLYAIIAIVGAWTAWALRRTKLLWVAVTMGLPLMFCVTRLSSYQYSLFLLPAVLIRQRKDLAPALLAVGAASQILWHEYYWVDDKHAAISWLFLVFLLMMLVSYSRPFSMERLRAWWRGRPERALSRAVPAPIAAK